MEKDFNEMLEEVRIKVEQELKEQEERERQRNLELEKGKICKKCDAFICVAEFKDIDDGIYFCGLNGKRVEGYSVCRKWKQNDPEKPYDRVDKSKAFKKIYKRALKD